MLMKEFIVFWVVAPSGVVIKYQSLQPWRLRQHSPLKYWYPTTTLYGTKIQKTMNSIFTAMKT